MVKLALTGRQLAELYALEAMGVPSDQRVVSRNIPREQTSYLVDTAEGRKTLLHHAEDLAEKIQSANDERIQNYINDHIEQSDASTDEAKNAVRPEPPALVEKALEFLQEKMAETGVEKFLGVTIEDTDVNREWWKSKQTRLDFYSASKTDMIRQAQRPWVSWEDLDESYDGRGAGDVEDAINDFATSVGDELNNGDWTDLIWQWWTIAKMRNPGDSNATVRAFMDSMRVLANDPKFQDDFWNYHWNDNWTDYASDYTEWLQEHEDEIRTELYDPEDAHFQIDDAVGDLYRKRWKAERSGRRSDYLALMAAIDHLSSMSHHGGPAFEYGDSTEDRLWRYPGEEEDPEPEPNLVEMMNRKFGDRFLPWLLASGNFPEKYLDQFQRWYDESIERESHDAYRRELEGRHGGTDDAGRAIDREVSSEGYYRHPYYSQRERWIAEHSPTFQNWTPFDSQQEDRANLQSVARSAYRGQAEEPRQIVMRDFLKERAQQHGYGGGPEMGVQPNFVNPTARRPRWDYTYASTVAGMTRAAAAADRRGAYDLADRIETLMDTILGGLVS